MGRLVNTLQAQAHLSYCRPRETPLGQRKQVSLRRHRQQLNKALVNHITAPTHPEFNGGSRFAPGTIHVVTSASSDGIVAGQTQLYALLSQEEIVIWLSPVGALR